MGHGARRAHSRSFVGAEGRRIPLARVSHMRRSPRRLVTLISGAVRSRVPGSRSRRRARAGRTSKPVRRPPHSYLHRRRSAAHRFSARHLPAGQLGGARDVRHVRHRLHGPPGADADPHARRLGGPSASPRLSGGRRGRGVLRGARDLANRPRGSVIESPGVTVTRTGEHGAFGGELLTVNFGPHHPSTHGVLRLIVDLDGEQIKRIQPVIGYLHTGIEKQMEALRWQQGVVVTDRHDYLSPPINNLAYALAVEKLMGVEVPPRAQALRVIMSELTRLSSHLVWMGTSGLELGAMSMLMYCFREREQIMDLNEEISGFRMHTSYIRPGGVFADATPRFLEMLDKFVREMPGHIDEYEDLLTMNPIWRARTIGIGRLPAEDAKVLGASGPMLRGSGVAWDLRKSMPYSGYESYDFEVAVSNDCDCYGRYLVRIKEMREAVKILRQALDRLPDGPVNIDDRKMLPPPREELETSMEAVIHHFKLFTEGYTVPAGDAYVAVESGRGENGCYIVSDGTHKPRRVKFRSASFVNLQALERMALNHMVADMIAIIGTADAVLGDCDR